MIRLQTRSGFPRHTLALILLISMLLPGTWGCAVFRDPVPPGFDSIMIRAEVERDREGQVEGDLDAYSTLKGVLVGAAIGAPSLALTVGLIGLGISLAACGPPAAATLFLAPITYVACVGVVTIGSTVGGFVVGLVGGIYVGVVGGLPSETAERVTEVLTRVEEVGSFDADLLAALRRAIPEEKIASTADGASTSNSSNTSNAASAMMTTRLENVELRQHSRDRLSIRLAASTLQAWEGDDATTKEKTCEYEYDSEWRPVKEWLVDDGAAFRESITQGLEVIARWINRDLEAFASETEFKQTKDSPESCYRRWRWYDNFLLF